MTAAGRMWSRSPETFTCVFSAHAALSGNLCVCGDKSRCFYFQRSRLCCTLSCKFQEKPFLAGFSFLSRQPLSLRCSWSSEQWPCFLYFNNTEEHVEMFYFAALKPCEPDFPRPDLPTDKKQEPKRPGCTQKPCIA